MNDRRIIITCVILLIVACFCIACISVFGAGFFFLESASSSDFKFLEEIPQIQSESIPTPEIGADSSGTQSQDSTSDQDSDTPNLTPGDGAISPEISSQMDEIQLQVIAQRGLKPSDDVNRFLYTPEELRKKFERELSEEYSPEEAKFDSIMLASFGLLEPDFDLYNFQIDLLSEQIGGFYDQETGEMVVVQGDDFGGIERLTYAHEYTHALQDQNYDIDEGLNFETEYCKEASEHCAAVSALLEGDATLTQLNWLMKNASPQDRMDILASMDEVEMPVFDSAPEIFTQDLLFPYEYGLAFVQHLYDKGGWGTVDRAYQNLPVSTEQILHPERYPDDIPIEIVPPDFSSILGSGWEEIDRGVMGEWSTYLILSKGLDENARLSEYVATQAAEGWGGDYYIVYYNADNESTVMVLQSVWDTSGDAAEFADAFREYAEKRFGKSSDDTWQGIDGYHLFNSENDRTTWILAPDKSIAESVWQVINP